ncbi:MAG: hypothetical protein AAGA30_22205, partial [Planctomycetota bacterium]
MPDYDDELAQWRSNLMERLPLLNAEVVDELELHIRDCVREKLEAGDDLRVAVLNAIEDFGSVDELSGEFEKVPKELLPWLPVKIVTGAMAIALLAVATFFVTHLQSSNLDVLTLSHVATILLGYASVACVGTLSAFFLICRLIRDPLPGQKRMFRWSAKIFCLLATIAMALGIVLGASCLIADTDPYVWSSSRDICGLVVLALSISMAAQFHSRQIRFTQVSAVFGLAANISVLIGALLIHENFAGITITSAVTMIAIHFVLAASVFAPPNS